MRVRRGALDYFAAEFCELAVADSGHWTAKQVLFLDVRLDSKSFILDSILQLDERSSHI